MSIFSGIPVSGLGKVSKVDGRFRQSWWQECRLAAVTAEDMNSDHIVGQTFGAGMPQFRLGNANVLRQIHCLSVFAVAICSAAWATVNVW